MDKAMHESVSLVCILTRPSVERLMWLEYLVSSQEKLLRIGSLLSRRYCYRTPIIWRIDSTYKISKVNRQVLSIRTAQAELP